MTDEEKAKLLGQQAELQGIPVRPEYLPGILANYSNFEMTIRKVRDGIEQELPLDPLPVYQP